MLMVASGNAPGVPGDRTHPYQSYVVALDGSVERDEVVRRMRESGVETTLGTYSLHAQPAYRAVITPAGASASGLAHDLTLPVYPGLTDDDLDTVTNALVAALSGADARPGGQVMTRGAEPVVIVDYGMGNMGSLRSMFARGRGGG